MTRKLCGCFVPAAGRAVGFVDVNLDHASGLGRLHAFREMPSKSSTDEAIVVDE